MASLVVQWCNELEGASNQSGPHAVQDEAFFLRVPPRAPGAAALLMEPETQLLVKGNHNITCSMCPYTEPS